MYVKLGNPSRKNKAEKIVIHNYDTWSMDHTLAHIIVPMLKQLREVKHGAPFVENNDVPVELQATEEELKLNNSGSTDDKYFDRWNYVMDEMIFAFQSKLEDWGEQFWSGEADMKFVEIPEKDEDGEELYTMEYGLKHTLELDKEGMKVYQDRINNGFLLFGKYYNGLWD
tara:strand:- start:149 stop:658 length:510 start_codon:yes stop_codon:yes gene_type:complete